MLMDVIVVSTGAFVAFVVLLLILLLYIRDVTQTRHSVLRNFPVIGHLRYFLERQGEYFRQYFFMGDRDEMPFNRSTRSWVYRLAKNEGGIIGFGSTYDTRAPGALIFSNAAFPVLDADCGPAPAVTIGEGYALKPFLARSIVNVSGMSFGAISKPAVQALSRGAAQAGCWMSTGEGGVAPYHLEGECDVIAQIGTAKYGVREHDGTLSLTALRHLASVDVIRAFELKLSQGAKPGKGGVLPGKKVTAEIARIRGIPEGIDSISPNRHPDIATVNQLLDKIAYLRDITGKPIGIKTAIGGSVFMADLCEGILRRGLAYAPDYIAVDGGEGGSGAAPQALADHMSLSLDEGLPLVIDALLAAGLKSRIKVIASGKIVTPARAAWAMCMGADFVQTARGFMFALGCIQALRCHTNGCPTGITTHDPRLQRGLVVEDKAERVAAYARNMNYELNMLAHSCSLPHARQFTRQHVRIMQPNGISQSLVERYPYPHNVDSNAT